MIKAIKEDLFLADGQKSALHCLVRQVNKPGLCTHAHYHKYCEILYGVDCDLDMLIGEKTEKLRDGDICFIYPNEPHYMYSAKEKNLFYVIKFFPEMLYYDGQSIRELYYLMNILVEDNRNERHLITKDESRGTIENILKDIFNEWNEKNLGYEFVIRGQILRIYSIMLRLMKKTKIEISTNSTEEFALIHNCIIYAAENLDSVTETILAEKCFMSNSQFSKMFKKHIGKTYKNFIVDMRIAEAKRQILATDKSITEIAYLTGFSSSSHFISSFKNKIGETPLQYRNKFILKAESDE